MAPNCACCWQNHQKCDGRTSFNRCHYCNARITTGINDNISHIEPYDLFPKDALRDSLLSNCSLFDLNTTESDFNSLHVHIVTANNHDVNIIAPCFGIFTYENNALAKEICEGFHRAFAVNLSVKNGASQDIYNACSAGALIYGYCSATFDERLERTVDGTIVDTEGVQLSIETLTKYFMLCKSAQLIDEVVKAIRMSGDGASPTGYAAAVILCHEINFFGDKLKYGTLFNHISGDIRDLLGGWLLSVARELNERIREGCARYPDWSCVIRGSMKTLRRAKERPNISLTLQQSKWSFPHPSQYLDIVPNEEAIRTTLPPMMPTPFQHTTPMEFAWLQIPDDIHDESATAIDDPSVSTVHPHNITKVAPANEDTAEALTPLSATTTSDNSYNSLEHMNVDKTFEPQPISPPANPYLDTDSNPPTLESTLSGLGGNGMLQDPISLDSPSVDMDDVLRDNDPAFSFLMSQFPFSSPDVLY